MSLVKRVAPVVFVSSVNRCGAIGLLLVPIILVEREFTTTQSSFVLTSIRVLNLVGAFFGAWLAGKIGNRNGVLLGYLVTGFGLVFTSQVNGFLALSVFASMAALGESMTQGPMRLMVFRSVDPSEKQEAMGWFRMGNNAAQVISYSIGSVFASLGAPLLIAFDGVTSFFASLVGFKILPYQPLDNTVLEDKVKVDRKFKSRIIGFFLSKKGTVFIGAALITGGYFLLMDLYLALAAAQAKIVFGEQGLKRFSNVMVINTVLCALLSVWMSRHMKKALWAFPYGIIVMVISCVMVLLPHLNYLKFFSSMFLATSGEVVFMALAQYFFMSCLPEVPGKSKLYGIGLVIQSMGRIVGSAIAFPLLAAGNHAFVILSMVALMLFCMIYLMRNVLRSI